MIKNIILLNGIYDIICAISILWFSNPYNYFSILHPKIFKNKTDFENPIIRRLLAYWILTYGIIRVFSPDINIIAMTYFIEAFCFEYERFIGDGDTVVDYKISFISLSSIIIILFLFCDGKLFNI